ncbi:MAG: hypothetical protein Q8S13_06735 [Dehalococcoidia bacterium]|nr:hypothetical protein [Dehalococcoidia bacterium]
MLTASFSTSMDSISYGLIPVRLPFGPGWIGMPSSTYSGALLPTIEVALRMRTAMPPSAVRVTVTPAMRPASTCSIGSPGARAMSSEVTVEAGGSLCGGALLRPWAHPETSPTSRPTGSSAHDEVMGPPV